MIFLLAGIVAMCAMICLAEGLVWVWEKLDPPAKVEEVRANEHSVKEKVPRLLAQTKAQKKITL